MAMSGRRIPVRWCWKTKPDIFILHSKPVWALFIINMVNQKGGVPVPRGHAHNT